MNQTGQMNQILAPPRAAYSPVPAIIDSQEAKTCPLL